MKYPCQTLDTWETYEMRPTCLAGLADKKCVRIEFTVKLSNVVRIYIFSVLFMLVIYRNLFIYLFLSAGDSGGEQRETIDNSLTGGEESDKDEKSPSEGKNIGDAENGANDSEESEEGEPCSEGKRMKSLIGIPYDTRQSDEDGSPHLEVKQPDVSRDRSTEEADKAERSDSQGTEADDSESNPVDSNRSGKKILASLDSMEAEISDDEPFVITFVALHLAL